MNWLASSHLDPESISDAKGSQLSSLEMMFPVPRRPVFPINLKVVWKGRSRLAVSLAVELKAVCHAPGVVQWPSQCSNYLAGTRPPSIIRPG